VLLETACGTIYRIVAKVDTLRIHGDVKQLLGCAPEAVESFSPGHWELLCRLGRDACEVSRQIVVRGSLTAATRTLSHLPPELAKPDHFDGSYEQLVSE
jgi:hypothetical protein